MNSELEFGNPDGAGRYGYIRSAKDYNDLISGKDARFDAESKRWFEHIYCGYACWRDGKASQEFDGVFLDEFEKEHPQAWYKEVFYDFQYGDTRDHVSLAIFWLTENEGEKYRDFTFELKDTTMKRLEECLVAVEKWHCTGELAFDDFSFTPCYGQWKKKSQAVDNLISKD